MKRTFSFSGEYVAGLRKRLCAMAEERDNLRRRLGRLRAYVRRWSRGTCMIGSDGIRSRHVRESEIKDALADKPPTKGRATQ